MAYIAIALMNHLVEGPLRDPASLNKPSTQTLADGLRIGNIPGTDVHWGLIIGLVACVLSWILIEKTRWGFAPASPAATCGPPRCRASPWAP